MKEELQVALLQQDLVWQDAEWNRRNFEEVIESLPEIDVIVLPEMFTTGFSMNAKVLAETMEGGSVEWMKYIAKRQQAAVVGSLIVKESGNYYNRLCFVHPEGKIEHYDKRHTFTLAGEDKVFTAGNSRLIVDYKGWKICPLICYDLRFPVWSRNNENYDVLLYLANWPQRRIEAWDVLLKARAIENMSYCLGVNRVGHDGNGVNYNGHSAAYDVLGKRIDQMNEPNKAYAEVVSLTAKPIKNYRSKLGFLKDRDAFTLSKIQ